ncbi:OLC1v1001952C1 [Oldenlandia corymbosa var. corymbosa]|uniref:Phospholipase n=1 Tax=Oldenlandia corymbosa var. corymbosa TaxID=529605 RepID=A0AAV1D6I1_OLDCO|nr:OLC1v1001952C1 [Oldenlandia corymbosa var. corymbosa]
MESKEMLTEKLIEKMPSSALSSSHSLRCYAGETARIFDELPTARILELSGPEAGSKLKFNWRLVKKASQVFYLHFALKKRAIIEEFYEKQEQVKEWLHHLGFGDHTAIVRDDDEPDDGIVPIFTDDSVKNRSVPSRAAFSVIRPALGRQHTVSEKAKAAMQGYLNHFLGNLDIVNTREVCKFLEVSKLSFSPEFGPKLKEDYVMVKRSSTMPKEDIYSRCCICHWAGCCRDKWEKVWAVLKPGFLALLKDPFDTRLVDIVVFDVLPASKEDGKVGACLAEEIKNRAPLRYAFKVSCGTRRVKLRSSNYARVKDWVSAINDVGLTPHDGWCKTHRFGSFAPPRGLADDGSQAQWFIDGKTAFEAIASSVEKAKSEIFITGWWLCPELYLRRPFNSHSSSRLDSLLEAKAKEGVKIYILLYKEVAIALKINSSYSKRKLLAIHENIKVLRYPNRFPTGVYLWSHHEKLVIVDHRVCYLGGLDLCFGRYDTNEHKVGDLPPSLWPGKDYYNPRESEPNSWEDTMKDELERKKYPRMPWHDVHCALWGPACRDVARHFVQRWNHAKRNTAPDEHQIPLLIPQQHMVIPHYMGSNGIEIKKQPVTIDENYFGRQDSFSSQSPSEDVPLLLPKEANSLNFSSLDEESDGLGSNQHDLNRVKDNAGSHELGEPDLGTSDNWWQSQERFCQSASFDEIGQVGPRTSCSCQVIRSVSHWSAGTNRTEDSIHKSYCSMIEKAEHFVYIENQFFISGLSDDDIIQNRVLEALCNRILQAHSEHKPFKVIVVIPLLPGFQGGIDDGGAATVRAIMHWQYRTICRPKNSILDKLNGILGCETEDYISFYGLRTHGKLSDCGPLVTSQVYVHSKVMIVDDRIALVGSANINDRSLLGSRDSEIGVVIEDKTFVDSVMNGESWKAGKFSSSLRISLWAEHLGLSSEEVDKIRDPIIDSTYQDLWMETARLNSKIYQDVFSCVPNDQIHSRSAFRQAMSLSKEKLGYNTLDLGVAPEKLEICEDGKVVHMDPSEKLQSVRGHLVSFPLQFMCQEDLRPVFIESEFYTSPQVFY